VIEKSSGATSAGKAFGKLTSFLARGTLELVTMPIVGEIEIHAKAPNKRFVVATIQGFGEVKQGYDSQVGWMGDPLQGLSELKGEALAISRRESTFNAALKWREVY